MRAIFFPCEGPQEAARPPRQGRLFRVFFFPAREGSRAPTGAPTQNPALWTPVVEDEVGGIQGVPTHWPYKAHARAEEHALTCGSGEAESCLDLMAYAFEEHDVEALRAWRRQPRQDLRAERERVLQ